MSVVMLMMLANLSFVLRLNDWVGRLAERMARLEGMFEAFMLDPGFERK